MRYLLAGEQPQDGHTPDSPDFKDFPDYAVLNA